MAWDVSCPVVVLPVKVLPVTSNRMLAVPEPTKARRSAANADEPLLLMLAVLAVSVSAGPVVFSM